MSAPVAIRSKETWGDWLAEGGEYPLTVDELLAAIKAHGEDVSRRDLSFWQSRGVIPYPVVRWHDGATRAFYPTRATNVIRLLCMLQRRGIKLRDIGTILQATIKGQREPEGTMPFPIGYDRVPAWAIETHERCG